MNILGGFVFLGFVAAIVFCGFVIAKLAHWWFEDFLRNKPKLQAATIIVFLSILVFFIGAAITS